MYLGTRPPSAMTAWVWVSQQVSLNGTIVPSYNNLDQTTSLSVNGTTYATMTYDAYGRLATTDYTQATNGTNKLRLTQINRDSLQRVKGTVFTFADNSTMTETATLSAQKGVVTADSFTQGGHTAGASYQYDAASRSLRPRSTTGNTSTDSLPRPGACTSIPGIQR
jgi:hypothetical protein